MESNQTPTTFLLTEFAHGGGCGCKIAPAVLKEILAGQTTGTTQNLIVGNAHGDDAAVYKTDDENALIATTDFFTPIVDDAFLFGKIAAANAISDVYAMGGKPLLALAILGWPTELLPASLAQQVIAGAREICREANIPLAGGHSIDSKEPIFGLSVNGMVALTNLKQNNTAQEGDFIFITKPIGTGILSAAQKRKVLAEEHLETWLQQLTKLNAIGEKLGQQSGVTAMTDVTGFGLLGHLHEMALGSGLSARLEYSKIPMLEAAKAYASQKIIPDATYRNWNAYSKEVRFEKGVNVMEAFNLLPDPQTNGGLLISVKPDAVSAVQALLKANGYGDFTAPIGMFEAEEEKRIVVG